MARPAQIELPGGERIPILYEDRTVLAIDKPAGWMLAPSSWRKTRRNLQSVLESSIKAGDFWARAGNVKFLRFVHRLDTDTSGVLLMVKSPGAIRAFTQLFESRRVEKVYLAVVSSSPARDEWVCRSRLAQDPKDRTRIVVDTRAGKDAETHFRVLGREHEKTLLEANPRTGRMHQIRVHLAASRCPVLGDKLYGDSGNPALPLGLRAVRLRYSDPFTKQRVEVVADSKQFLKEFGFPAGLAERISR